MREFPIKKFWYGKGAAYKDIEELMEKKPGWLVWAIANFQDVTPQQAKHFQELYDIELPEEAICSQELLDEINGGLPYEYKKGDSEEVYKELCRKYATARGEEWNEWLKS